MRRTAMKRRTKSPPGVTYVLNHLCYLCPDRADLAKFRIPNSAFRIQKIPNPNSEIAPPPRHRYNFRALTFMKLAFLATTALLTMTAFAADAPKLQTIPLKDIDGKDTSLKAYD